MKGVEQPPPKGSRGGGRVLPRVGGGTRSHQGMGATPKGILRWPRASLGWPLGVATHHSQSPLGVMHGHPFPLFQFYF
jgi:hypothetical protein